MRSRRRGREARRGVVVPRIPLLAVLLLGSTVVAPLVAPLVAQARDAEFETAPIVIRRGVLLTPPEVAESGLAPEVGVRATIDERGRVSDVEVLSVTPSTEFDERIAEATRFLVGGWRYAPARDAQGDPVPATLSWTLSYAEAAEAGVDEVADAAEASAPLENVSSPAVAAELRMLPEERIEEILDRWSATADRRLDVSQRRAVNSTRFHVVTDARGEDVVRTVAINLEASFNFLDGLLAEDIEPLPFGPRIRAYFYARRTSLLSLAAAMGHSGSIFGFYRVPGLLALHQELADGDEIVHALLHEATHAYLHRYLIRPGVAPGSWFQEGLAEYVGNSTVNRRGEIEIGRTLRGRYVLDYHGGASRRTTDAGWSLDRTRDAIRRGEAPTIGELLLTPRALFTGEDGPLLYGTSWLLLHFLRHGDAEARGGRGETSRWAEERFPELLLYILEGYPDREALETAYGMSLDEMDERFREYVRRF